MTNPVVQVLSIDQPGRSQRDESSWDRENDLGSSFGTIKYHA
jgi:hypothetical protein